MVVESLDKIYAFDKKKANVFQSSVVSFRQIYFLYGCKQLYLQYLAIRKILFVKNIV